MSLKISLASLAVASVASIGALGQSAIAKQSDAYRQQKASFRYSCRPPLKFAAGACVKRCPAGYQNTGRYCRFRSMSR